MDLLLRLIISMIIQIMEEVAIPVVVDLLLRLLIFSAVITAVSVAIPVVVDLLLRHLAKSDVPQERKGRNPCCSGPTPSTPVVSQSVMY